MEQRFRLAVETMEGHNRDATPADIIAAIEADEGLREEVCGHMWPELGRMRQHMQAAESERDAWRARAEKAENEAGWLAAWRVDMLAKIERLEQERDTAVAQRREVERLCAESVAKAEKERDEARAERDALAREARGLEESRDYNARLVYEARANLDALQCDLRSLCEVGVDATLHRNEARAIRDKLRGVVGALTATIARLEKELAEANAKAEHLAFLSQGYAEENGRIKSELDAARRSVGRLERELATARDTDGQPWNMTTADAEELRARRKLDGWERDGRSRSVGVTASLVRPESLVFAKEEDQGDPRRLVTAATYPELARKLGLLG